MFSQAIITFHLQKSLLGRWELYFHHSRQVQMCTCQRRSLASILAHKSQAFVLLQTYMRTAVSQDPILLGVFSAKLNCWFLLREYPAPPCHQSAVKPGKGDSPEGRLPGGSIWSSAENGDSVPISESEMLPALLLTSPTKLVFSTSLPPVPTFPVWPGLYTPRGHLLHAPPLPTPPHFPPPTPGNQRNSRILVSIATPPGSQGNKGLRLHSAQCNCQWPR